MSRGKKLSYGMAINEALHQIMEQDERVFVLGEDVAKMGGDFGITKGIWAKWPDRIKDTALSESAILGLSCGAAVCGLKPVPEIMFADFLGVGFDQITNNAAKLNYMYQGKAHCGITVRAPQGGGIRCAYHHSACVESWFMNTPGLVIVCPTTPYEAKGLLISAIATVASTHAYLWMTAGLSVYAFGIGLANAGLVRLTLFASEMSKGTVSAAMGMLQMLIFTVGIEVSKHAYEAGGSGLFSLLNLLSGVLWLAMTVYFLKDKRVGSSLEPQ